MAKTRDTRPRYQILAATLRASIESGEYAVGSTLPTEHDLCRIHGVSRHTAREALRLLLEMGLIARRRGVGTIVERRSGETAFAQPLGGIDDLMKYAREARLQILSYGDGALTAGEARKLGAPRQWAHKSLIGVRVLPDKPPIGLTRIHIDSALAPSAEITATLEGAISEWISQTHGVSTANIKQTISAALLDDATAKTLSAKAGSAGLRTVRRYYDAGGRVFVVSDTLHPADRFAYEMTFRRDKADD